MRRILIIATACMAVTGCDDDETTAPIMPQYEIEITNLTTGQPMTPPAVALHRASVDIWSIGQAASPEVQEIAENGNLDPMEDLLSGDSNVTDFALVSGTPAGPLMPGQTRTVTLTDAEAGNRLSIVAMLICTNDGFTGLDAIPLPATVDATTTSNAMAYDAGSELNTENWDDIVPPCAGLTGQDNGGAGSDTTDPALAEDGVIAAHLGIAGGVDLLTAVHDWTDPVMEIVVTRTR